MRSPAEIARDGLREFIDEFGLDHARAYAFGRVCSAADHYDIDTVRELTAALCAGLEARRDG